MLLPLICLLVANVSGIYSYAITGPQGGVNNETGERPSRQDINSLSGPALDLYILALQQFFASDQATELSYYQVAGIHGLPDIPWDGVTGGDYQVGYCTHSSILFPTWHRPYVALFEQILWSNAQNIATQYPDGQQADYIAAAVTLRSPYWDWSTSPTMPSIVNEPEIDINTPDGQQSIVNPLFNYTFHPHPSAQDFPPGGISDYNSTVRYPDANGFSQPDLVNQQLEANAQSLHDLTYQLLASEPDYGPFSNTGYTDADGNTYNSLENMHNEIHGIVGSGGHMGYLAYAAFDPIFWLHHTNVDRLFAIWEALYPDSFTIPEADHFGTYTNPAGEIEDVNTPLTPFHSDSQDTLYSSASVRGTRSFGYTYKEISDWNVDSNQLAQNVRQIINDIYNPGSSSKRDTNSTSVIYNAGSTSQRDTNSTSVIYNAGSTSKRDTDSTSITTSDWQWQINIRIDKNLLSDSLTFNFYLGPAPSSQVNSLTPALVATHCILLPASTRLLSLLVPNPPNRGNRNYAHGSISLTSALRKTSLGDTLDPTHALSYIKSNLQWRAQFFNGTIVSNDFVKKTYNVRMRVVAREVLHPGGGSEFPSYGPWQRNQWVGEVQRG